MAAAMPAINSRVRILKDYATVRYVGPVTKQEGTWVGVEWDDPSRGKHDGATAGVRYFSCSSTVPTAGSFVRIERVGLGVGLLEALRARYNNETAENGEEVDANELYVHTSGRRRVQVLLVGEEKIQQRQRQIHMLESARLVGLDVATVAIARVSGLASLNGAEIRPRERRDAELRYLQHCATEMAAAGADEAGRSAVRAAHPRLRRLMELHGAVLATAATGGSAGGSLASSTAELKLTCVAAAATAKMGTQ
ncbi:Tubulin-specific chaperone E, partial [Tetrabaena socialis]